jgi:diguanylate cyclase (GGDEF)-like protein/PAS domain S-box-containing protein
MSNDSLKDQPRPPIQRSNGIRLWPYVVPIVAVWTVVLGGSLLWNQARQQRETREFALIASRASFDKDALYRRWNAALGGVYGQVTATSQPNPYLSEVSERDLNTPSGSRLTLIDPAYMLRQVYELSNAESQIRGHITSTNPLRPENAPDAWEVEALHSFEHGLAEAQSLVEWDGRPYLRLMRPLFVEQDCLKCHAHQGYRVGQIRGGISISMPLTQLLAEGSAQIRFIWLSHGLVWLLGMSGIVLGLHRVRYHLKKQHRAEQALRHSEARLRGLGAAAPIGIFRADVDGNCVYVNERWCGITGMSPEETSGKGWVKAIHPDDREWVLATWKQPPGTGSKAALEYRLTKSDGAITWVSGRVVPLKDDAGAVSGYLGAIEDITGFKLAQEELQSANDFLEHVLNSSPDAIGIVNQRGRFTKWNKMAEEVFGYHFDELKGGSFSELYADEHEMEQMLAVLRQQGYVRRYEMDMKRKDGSVFPSSLSISVLRNRAGEVDGSICVARDITETRKRMAQINEVNKHLQEEILERERMEDAIQDTNEKLKSLVLEYGQHNQEITVLNEMSDMLQACLDCEEAHGAIAKFLPRLFADESGAMYMLQRNQLTAVASWGEALASEPVFSPDACWALRLSEVHLVDDEGPGLPCKHRSQELPASTLCVPMTAQGATLGLLFLQVDRQPTTVDTWEQPTASVSESKQRLAVTAAKQISLSIANLQLRDHLRRQAVRDPLTGMYNRRYLDDTLERELLRAKRKNTTISIIMVDIDWFKSINDSFGHEAGDTVLTVVAKSLKDGVRGEDVVCRYGGEEFILVLPEAPTSSALERAEHLRERIAQLEIEHEGTALRKITASFGVASFPDHGQTIEGVIKAADAAMYRAKTGGRNRVEVA